MPSLRSSDACDKIGNWTRLHRLGKGGFGTVYLGKRNTDGKIFAVKSTYFVPQDPSINLSKDPVEHARAKIWEENALSSLINEIRTLKKLKSPYIIRCLGCGTSRGPPEMDGRLLLDCYLEYLPRGSLGDLFDGPLDEPFIRAYTKDILRALLYLHFNKLVHGDLKAVNVLMDESNCKLADFGSVKDVRTSFFSKILFGTRGYRAPEVEAQVEQTYASDIFSLGCTVQSMATGRSPYFLKELGAGQVSASRSPRNNPKLEDLSDELTDFLSKCMAHDPWARWTASDLLKHPFISTPSSPRWLPYAIPLPFEVKRQRHNRPIVPQRDEILDSSLPAAPFSPIHVVPMKKRKLDFNCVNSVDKSEVTVPGPPPWTRFRADPPPYPLANDPAGDAHSESYNTAASKYSPRFKLDLNHPPGPDSSGSDNSVASAPTPRKVRQRFNGQKNRRAQAAIKRLSLAPRLVLAEMNSSRKLSEVGSCAYGPFKVQFPGAAVAQLRGDLNNDEDRSPLVVKICSEFEIPLPVEYQKWIRDPDFDPNSPPPRRSKGGGSRIADMFKRAFGRLIPKPTQRRKKERSSEESNDSTDAQIRDSKL
ncbi:unnamed protein product [Calypogeia fissa]